MSLFPELNAKFAERFSGKLTVNPVFREETTWAIDPSILVPLLTALRDEEDFDFLVDVSGVDNFGQEPRFEMVYELFSYKTLKNLRVKTWVSEDHLEVPTVSHLWRTADWHERETYDMMGIHFAGHPDLRRILMWDGYPYYPLRKDFPLEGKVSDLPDLAFSNVAPLEGGPFVTSPADLSADREPRARPTEI